MFEPQAGGDEAEGALGEERDRAESLLGHMHEVLAGPELDFRRRGIDDVPWCGFSERDQQGRVQR